MASIIIRFMIMMLIYWTKAPVQLKKHRNLVVACKKTCLEVNAVKSVCMSVSRDQNDGQNHIVSVVSNSFERVEQFKHLGETITNKNSFLEIIKRRLKLGNSCLYSVRLFCLQVSYPKL
jgi:hypothetical protein